MNASLKPGPTYRSADLGNSEISPVWSQCQWLQMTPSTLLSSSPPSLRTSLMLLGTFRPGMPFLMEACAAGAWFHQSLRQPRSNCAGSLGQRCFFREGRGEQVRGVSRAVGCSSFRGGFIVWFRSRTRSLGKADHDCLPKLLVPDKKSKSRQIHVFMPLLDRLHKGFRRDHNIGRGIDDGNLNRGVGSREVE